MTTEAPADEEKEREAGATDGKATVVRTRAKLALQAGELVRIARAVLERSWRAGAKRAAAENNPGDSWT